MTRKHQGNRSVISTVTLCFNQQRLEERFQRHIWLQRRRQNTIAASCLIIAFLTLSVWTWHAGDIFGSLELLLFSSPLGAFFIYSQRKFQQRHYDLICSLSLISSISLAYCHTSYISNGIHITWTIFFLFPLIFAVAFHLRVLYTAILLAFGICLHYHISLVINNQFGLSSDFLQTIHLQVIISTGVAYLFYRLISFSRRESFFRWRLEMLNKWNLQSINHELEKANQTISQEVEKQDQMISWISHDIRTPLHSILNLLCSSRMQNSEEREEILSSIHSSGKMMQRMVNGLLHLSSQQPDSSNPKNEAIQIETYIDELRQILLPLALEKKLELSGSYIGPADLTIEAAREYLDQITINLLTNSIKYTEAGKIDFRIEATRNAKNKINLTFIVENKSLVDDKDINLPEPILSAAYPVTTDSFGFGLRIAQKAADKLKGNLLVEHSKNSCSAIFKFTAMTKLGQDSHSLVMIDRPDTELTIAWIDDERLNTLVGRTLFEELGIRTVLYYNSGKDAFAELQSIRCDYIFIDLVMPGWDGYQTFKMLSPLDTCTQSKWVAMSAHHTRKEIRHAYLMGYDQFLAKPFNKSDLAQTLNMIITVPQHLKKTEQSYRDAALIISQDLPEAIETLRKGLQLQDRECIRTSSHKLKGISGILQLNDYYALFEKMEKSPSGFGEQELDDMNSKFSKLENSVLLFSNSMNSVFG